LDLWGTRRQNAVYIFKRKKKKGRKEGRWQHMPISKLGTVKQETVTESGQLLLSEYQASQEETEKK
jgi:sarcosine oxidase delta subunit